MWPTRQDVIEGALLTLLLAIGLCGCWTRGRSVLILDEQWSLERAESDCKSRDQFGLPRCSSDPAVEIKSSEVEISNSFRSDPECTGIVLLTLNVSNGASYVSTVKTRWLFLELSGGVDQQKRWTVARSDNPSEHYSLTGMGDAKQIVHDSCRFVRGTIGAL